MLIKVTRVIITSNDNCKCNCHDATSPTAIYSLNKIRCSFLSRKRVFYFRYLIGNYMLEKLNLPDDLKWLKPEAYGALCREIREFLVRSVSKTGGHLASNLGIVELTLALHTVFDMSVDRLVFDVGHQCYVHKILTGRMDQFSTLRQLGGLSGFPKPTESVYDAFIAGHASNSISVALGLARARTLKESEHSVIALIGDGALTGGMAYEALCDAGGSAEPLIVVLNDNGMSITENVGGMARYLSQQRLRPSYIKFKKAYRRFTSKIPGGRAIYGFTHRIKTAIKHAILRCSMFEEMGFYYIGPVNGHNITELCGAFTVARNAGKPVLIHVVTQKGRGYARSELTPEAYHGVSSFDPESGIEPGGAETFSSVFGDTMTKLAEENESVVAVTAAMMSGTGLEPFAAAYPKRVFDVGITEGHAAAMTAGLAAGGMIPVFAVYSTFLQRSYDMLLHDVALSGLHAVFAIDRAGIVPGDGETHQGVFDTAFLATVPGMKIYTPASFNELRDMLRLAVLKDTGPVAVRYPKGPEGIYKSGGTEATLKLRDGTDVTLVTYGIMTNVALEATELLAIKGISAEVIKLGEISPLDTRLIAASVAKTGVLVVVEDSAKAGSVGESLLSRLTESGKPPQCAMILSTGDMFLPGADVKSLRELCGIDAKSVAETVSQICREKSVSGMV